MNDVPRRPRPPDAGGSPGSDPTGAAAGAGLADVDQLTIRPDERRFAEGLPSDGPNGQSSTRMWVARPTDPGAIAGMRPALAPRGAEETEDRFRGAPSLGGLGERDRIEAIEEDHDGR
jgi:hypothetical protein